MESSSPSVATRRVTFGWMARLRWLAGAVQIVVLLAAWAAGLDVPVWPLVAVLVVGIASNALLARAPAGRLFPDVPLLLLLCLDATLLTALLALTGGASNPFSGVYLVVVGLGALVLRPPTTVALLAWCALAYGTLFTEPFGGGGHLHHPGMRGHLIGMWVAFVVGATFLVFAVLTLRARVTDAEREVDAARAIAERSSRLAALATLAAGAAHELATPLSTVAVVAGELERSPDPDVRSDGTLLSEQVARCRAILSQLAADSGVGLGEDRQRVALDALIAEAIGARAVRVEPGPSDRALVVPVTLLVQALHRLLDNALQASADVTLTVEETPGRLAFVVRDRGAGMAPEVLARVGEPFFTTRPTGEGMGLGVYFARSVAEHLCGGLALDSAVGRGTTATLWIPDAEEVG